MCWVQVYVFRSQWLTILDSPLLPLLVENEKVLKRHVCGLEWVGRSVPTLS